MWRFLAFVAVLMGLVTAAWYFKGPLEITATPRPEAAATPTQVAAPLGVVNAGTPPVAAPPPADPGQVVLKDAIHVAGATLFPAAEQDVAARTDGQIQTVLVRLGDRVSAGQVLARMDERVAQAVVEAARIEAESEAAVMSAVEQERATRQIYEKDVQLGKSVSDVDRLIHFFQWKKAQADVVDAREKRNVARSRYAKALLELEMHSLKTEIAGEISLITKKQGDPVRASETVFHVINTDRVWAEGFVEAEHAAVLKTGMRVLVEPERQEAPLRELRRHTAPVIDLAMSPDSVLLASASEDGTVVVWDWRRGQALWVGRSEQRTTEFYSVAFSPLVEDGPQGRTYTLAAGGGDGDVRVWTLRLDPRAGLSPTSSQVLRSPSHSGRILALAFAPNGQFLASGGADRNILLWNWATRSELYRFPAKDSRETAHRGAVTALLFSPAGELISASTDKTIKCWQLDQNYAVLRLQLEGRSGDVLRFNLSPDGQHILFEKDEELRLVSLQDGSLAGVMKSRDGLFRNLALFAPRSQMVLTSSANGRLQLWRTPAPPRAEQFFRQGYRHQVYRNSWSLLGVLADRLGPSSHVTRGIYAALAAPQPRSEPLPVISFVEPFPVLAATAATPLVNVAVRPYEGLTAIPTLWSLGGFELRHLRCPETAGVLCGAFAPGLPVAATGGKDHVIRVWPLPTESEATIEGIVTYVGTQVQSGTTLTRLRAEFANPRDGRRLKLGSKVNLTLYPETAP
jgi:WD40 repeat protein